MRQKRIVSTSDDAEPEADAWPEKKTWLSDEIACPETTDIHVRFIIECNKDATYGYPRLYATMVRYGSIVSADCSSFQWDIDDPDTVTTETDNVYESFAWTKEGSDCDPLYLVLPDIVETDWSCADPTQSCCGGYIQSGDPPPDPIPPFRMSVIVSE